MRDEGERSGDSENRQTKCAREAGNIPLTPLDISIAVGQLLPPNGAKG